MEGLKGVTWGQLRRVPSEGLWRGMGGQHHGTMGRKLWRALKVGQQKQKGCFPLQKRVEWNAARDAGTKFSS